LPPQMKAEFDALCPRRKLPAWSRQVGDLRERSAAERFTANTAAMTGQWGHRKTCLRSNSSLAETNGPLILW